MKPIVAIVLALTALSVVSNSVVAAEKTCKAGKVYDEVKRKCVTPRGS